MLSLQYKAGQVGIILSIPHGGLLNPEHVPDRVCKCEDGHQTKKCPVILKNDGYTIDLGLAIAESIKNHFDCDPFLVVNHLRRSKLDPNREVDVGAQDDATVVEAFHTYHGYVQAAKDKLGRGLLIDLHGQCKSQGTTELGYCITKSDLISKTYSLASSSIARLASEYTENPEDLISGHASLGHYIQEQGYVAMPSPGNVIPGIIHL
jgi:hypothetical protein